MARKEGETGGMWEQTMCADRVKTVRAIKKYLCSDATSRGKEPDPEVCRKCESQCAFGRKFIRLKWEEENNMPPRKNASEMTAQETIEKLSKEVDELTKVNNALAKANAELEQALLDANKRATEEHEARQHTLLTMLRLKAHICDMEHPDEW